MVLQQCKQVVTKKKKRKKRGQVIFCGCHKWWLPNVQMAAYLLQEDIDARHLNSPILMVLANVSFRAV